jgi:hypothetical protein
MRIQAALLSKLSTFRVFSTSQLPPNTAVNGPARKAAQATHFYVGH